MIYDVLKKVLPSWNISLFVQTCWEIMLWVQWILQHIICLSCALQLGCIVVGFQWLLCSEQLQPQVTANRNPWKILHDMLTCFNWKVLWYMNQAGYHWISIYSNLTLRCLQLLCNHTEHFYVDTVEPRWREWWSQVAWLCKGYVAGIKAQEKVEQKLRYLMRHVKSRAHRSSTKHH